MSLTATPVLSQTPGGSAAFVHAVPKPESEWRKDGEQRGDAWLEQQQAFLARIDAAPGWQHTASGLRFRLKSAASKGQRPASGTWVKVRYVGRLADGTEFHRSPGKSPIEAPLAGVIAGWREGVPMMRTGESWRFVVPPALGYGDNGRGPIPGGAVLVFDITLVAVETPAQE